MFDGEEIALEEGEEADIEEEVVDSVKVDPHKKEGREVGKNKKENATFLSL